MQNSKVQTRLTNYFSEKISKEINCKATVGRVGFSFFDKLKLSQILLLDFKSDTILQIDNLKIGISKISLKSDGIKLGNIQLEGGKFKLVSDSLNILNIDPIIHYFSSEDTVKSETNLSIDEIEITDFYFQYQNQLKSWSKEISGDHLDIFISRILFEDIYSENSGLNLTIHNIKCKEKQGFELNSFYANTFIDSTGTAFSNFKISTNKSFLNSDYLKFNFSSSKELKYFTTKILIDGQFNKSELSISDLSYFSDNLKGSDEVLIFEGDIKGTINNIKAKKLEIEIGSNSKIITDIDIKGLPDINESFVFANIRKLEIFKTDIINLDLPDIAGIEQIQIPSSLDNFNTIVYKGNFTGFLNNFVSYGTVSTELGNISTDILIDNSESVDSLKFSGKILTDNFQIGKLVKQDKLLGNITTKIELNGSFSRNKLYADIFAFADSIDFNNYTYQNTSFEGLVDGKKYNGILEVDDENLKFSLNGYFDLSNDIPIVNSYIYLDHSRPDKLNIQQADSLSSLKFKMIANFSGFKIDDFKGNINTLNLEYKNHLGKINIDTLFLTGGKQSNIPFLDLQSEILDISINGKYNFASIYPTVKQLLGTIIPSKFSKQKTISTKENDFSFDINLKDLNPSLALLHPQLKLAKNSQIKGVVSKANKDFSVELNIPEAIYNGAYFKSSKIFATSKDSSIISEMNCESLVYNNNLKLDNFTLELTGHHDSLNFRSIWTNISEVTYSGNILGKILFPDTQSTKPDYIIEIDNSDMIISDTIWLISPFRISSENKKINIKDFLLKSQNQLVSIKGCYSKEINDTLEIDLKNVSIAQLNLLLNTGYNYSGKLNGFAKKINNESGSFIFSNFDINNCSFEKIKIGNFSISSDWDNEQKKISINAINKLEKLKTVDLKGEYFPTTGQIDFNLALDKFRVSVLESFLDDEIDDLLGLASGNIQINGNTSKPQINGKLALIKNSLTVKYLNTNYSLSDSVFFNNNSIYFNNLKLNDTKFGSTAIASGSINHNYLKDFSLNLKINIKDFLCLDTKEQDNELYFGKAFASGLVKITGPFDDILINIDAKTETGTRFFIPLTSGGEIGQNSFIHFVKPKTIKNESILEENIESESSFALKFNLEVTEEAEVQLLFDSKVGDIIKSKGNALLNMEVNSEGDFTMFGDYEISEGDYTLTLQNFFSKRFDIEKGGTIKWSGNPYDAQIDIKAIYSVATTLDNLFLDTSSIYRQRVPVNCVVDLKNSLMNPNMEFNIDLPDSDPRISEQISSLTTNEKNKQFLSLLAINRFQPLSYLSTGNENLISGYSIQESGSELLSNQLSHWLSQISNDFDIGLNYRPGDAITSDEVELALETQLWNDRIRINGNFGVGGQYEYANTIVGDVDIDAKLNKSGKLRLKFFNKANNTLQYDEAPYTQGIGLFYREEFEKFSDIIRRKNPDDIVIPED